MKTRSKRYNQAKEKIDQTKEYEIEEAIGILKSLESAKFDQTVDLTVRLGINPKKTEQMVRDSISLPHGLGKSRKVIVFADGEEAQAAKQAGADEVGNEELIKKISGGWIDFDIAIALPRIMKQISKLGKILGPQGKMPSLKAGTVTTDVVKAVKEFKAGRLEFRSDAGGIVHIPVGKVSFKTDALKQNIEAFIERLKSIRPSTVKGVYIQGITLSATMSPGISLKEKTL